MAQPPRRRRFEDDDDRPVNRESKSSGSNMLLIGLVGGGLALFLLCGGVIVGGWMLFRTETRPVPRQPDVATGPIGKPDEFGVTINVNPEVQAETGRWQRLTPADHPVTLLAPGTPQPGNEIKVRILQGETIRSPQPPKVWEAKGSAGTIYFLIQASLPSDPGPFAKPGDKPLVKLGSLYIANGAPTEMTGKVQIDGMPGEQYGPEKGWPLNYRFVYRMVTVGDRVYVFGANSKPDDPAVQKFLDSFKLARGSDGQPVGPIAPSAVGLPGLTAYLTFDKDPAGGGPALDAVSGKSIGMPIGAVGRAPGIRGQALDLSRGGSFQLAGLESATTAAAGRPFSVALWFKTPAANGTLFLAGTKGKTPRYPHLEIGLMPKTFSGETTQMAFIRRLPGPADRKLKAGDELIDYSTPVTGSWTHVAFTRDAAGKAILYVNGFRGPPNIRDGVTGVIGGPDAVLGGLAAIPKGEFDPPPDPKMRTPFAGLIDEVAFFNVALTPEQVQKLAGQ